MHKKQQQQYNKIKKGSFAVKLRWHKISARSDTVRGRDTTQREELEMRPLKDVQITNKIEHRDYKQLWNNII